jgi:hypothetical protein
LKIILLYQIHHRILPKRYLVPLYRIIVGGLSENLIDSCV